MNFQDIIPDQTIALFVKNIWVFEGGDENAKTRLPFFADGYPGLLFQQAENGLIIYPHNKEMPTIFLYGQTIKPIELELSGPYLILIFQLYPFVLRTFFDVDPQSINDNCYYLDDSLGSNITELNKRLLADQTIEQRVKIISDLLLFYFERKKQNLDFKIRQAIELIIVSKGQQSMQAIAKETDLHVRTFERRFLTETGLAPKQFAKIIQFQASLKQLTVKDYSRLTDIVYENGFSDQSHFIRVFKAFTGKTPKNFTQ
ncbi:AraC family transcriptional regulator [Sphingobacterium sp. SRCM116780]|uniref:helix-turn-helix domain-containing protein n=1 Tax=Sphingobacterium sp. SRCM116780 TaxID=2907623 RepID=UPI001F1C29F0|nr:AraC family transcriptional regulator [Sphingobacterium sp. SRCM116780]UIR57416.1 AraC family transcriptional regulator [Sphingobacterium sp. SRCM116780]